MKASRQTLSLLLCAGLLPSCTFALPAIGEVRAAGATRSTGIKHQSQFGLNVLGGLALDATIVLSILTLARSVSAVGAP